MLLALAQAKVSAVGACAKSVHPWLGLYRVFSKISGAGKRYCLRRSKKKAIATIDFKQNNLPDR
jgi:hypothetical protein